MTRVHVDLEWRLSRRRQVQDVSECVYGALAFKVKPQGPLLPRVYICCSHTIRDIRNDADAVVRSDASFWVCRG